MNETDDIFACPHCGADVHARASFCKECGASDEDGWSATFGGEHEFGADLADDDDFDYDDYLRREFPDHAETSSKQSWKSLLVWIVVILLCITLLLPFLF